jgi:hypothetical protein
MSSVTKKAIYEILIGDSALVAIIGKDENGDPAVFNSTYDKVTAEIVGGAGEDLYPIITFRESAGSSDQRFRAGTVDNEGFDLEIWARTESGLVVSEIANRVDQLLHNQEILVDSGAVFDCVRMMQNPDGYDEKLKLHFGLMRYRLVVQRG